MYLQSFIVSKDDNGSNLLEKGNVEPGRSCTYQSVKKTTDKANMHMDDFVSGFVDFNGGNGPSNQKDERVHLGHDLPSLPSSWPTRTLHAQLDNSTSAEEWASLDRPLLAVSQPPLKPKFEQNPKIGQRHVKTSPDAIFRPMEDYIIRFFRICDNLNESFHLCKPPAPLRSVSEGTMTASQPKSQIPKLYKCEEEVFEMDEKTLLLGDVAENGAWWLGKHHTTMSASQKLINAATDTNESGSNAKLPRTDWIQLHGWYQAILTAGQDWSTYISEYSSNSNAEKLWNVENLARIESDIGKSSAHLRRTLLKATESLLRRPGRPLKTPGGCRFLLLLLANPLLYPAHGYDNKSPGRSSESDVHGKYVKPAEIRHETQPSPIEQSSRKDHAGIVKRILGLMANVSPESHRQLISWLARYPDEEFRKLVDLVGGFVTHRLIRQRRRLQTSQNQNPAAVVIPDIPGPGAGTSAQLHAALTVGPSTGRLEKLGNSSVYCDDWQVKAAAKVMSLLFQANNSGCLRQQGSIKTNSTPEAEQSTSRSQVAVGQPRVPGCRAVSKASLKRARKHGQLLPASAFYNTLLDYCDLVADFEAWENRRGSFSFCQYPMFLSLWAKIRILEHDARRQMEIRARQAFFNSIMHRSAVSQYLLLKVRRECLVDDSLRAVSEVVGSGQEEIKKSLRIAFQGEEGVDAGGLRKEWFLLLVREVFDPEHGMFVYDDDSQYCYFNPNTYETSDQYFLVGVVLGLAIYNSTILDVALPPFVFRKLLASAPTYTGPVTSLSRPHATHTLPDLAEFRPLLASGLQKLLDYDGDVEGTFCRDFVIESDRYGHLMQVPLCPDGEFKAVTNDNRAEFVELYIKYLLDTSVSRQFEPFKRGFFSVCGGNALSLFRPEEIELLVRGSDEPLDVATLRAVAIYDGWKETGRPGEEAVIVWFWELFAEAAAREQRALLSFITGSDRLPAMGATSLIIKISCLGNDTRRFPVARTCFNMLGLYRYRTKETLRSRIWTAVTESQGFGLK
ncbi:Putative E3 ubiquitin-protein ligase [Xanthoria parietina]